MQIQDSFSMMQNISSDRVQDPFGVFWSLDLSKSQDVKELEYILLKQNRQNGEVTSLKVCFQKENEEKKQEIIKKLRSFQLEPNSNAKNLLKALIKKLDQTHQNYLDEKSQKCKCCSRRLCCLVPFCISCCECFKLCCKKVSKFVFTTYKFKDFIFQILGVLILIFVNNLLSLEWTSQKLQGLTFAILVIMAYSFSGLGIVIHTHCKRSKEIGNSCYQRFINFLFDQFRFLDFFSIELEVLILSFQNNLAQMQFNLKKKVLIAAIIIMSIYGLIGLAYAIRQECQNTKMRKKITPQITQPKNNPDENEGKMKVEHKEVDLI